MILVIDDPALGAAAASAAVTTSGADEVKGGDGGVGLKIGISRILCCWGCNDVLPPIGRLSCNIKKQDTFRKCIV